MSYSKIFLSLLFVSSAMYAAQHQPQPQQPQPQQPQPHRLRSDSPTFDKLITKRSVEDWSKDLQEKRKRAIKQSKSR